MKLAIVGATGLVGSEILKVLQESNMAIEALLPVASARSQGRTVYFRGKSLPVITYEQALAQQPDYAIFSAGGSVSLELAPLFAAAGCRVVDNSSAWRMDPTVPLVVPEVNLAAIEPHHRIIANPNCSTIQMVMVLQPVLAAFGLRRVVVSTYQSVSGSGQRGVDQLLGERLGVKQTNPFYPHSIDLNILPQVDAFLESGYSKEEMKMINETRKIMRLPALRITATTVRVPVMGGHSESLNVETERPFTLAGLRQAVAAMPGVVVQDDPASGHYPMPLHAQGKNEVFAGRFRVDDSVENGFNCWVVADNLRKGAATNAVQVVEALAKKATAPLGV